MDIVDRIFDLADKKYREQRNFSADLGVAPSVVSAWRCRKSESYNRRLPQIAELLGTSTEYLLTGKKEPAGQMADGNVEEAARLFSKLTPQEQEFFLSQLHGVVDPREK